ncbi:hypothetical protein HDV06_004166 [Boothiomyces sp. JEL0866]|nr:hypothetical protein HDV06_004166 [Boothiomyces sp. JEL0866]
MDEINSIVQNSIYSKYPFANNFCGSLTACGTLLLDRKTNNHNLYFIFPHIHVKAAGEYRILCHVVNIENPLIIVSKYTRPFKILTRPYFEKPKSVTAISEDFEKQGIEANYCKQFHQ